MLFVTPEFSNKTETYTSLICQIDSQIYKIAKTKMDNIRYGFNTYVNFDKYDDLVTYRSILIDIMYCATGLCDVNAVVVVNKVKHLINTPC